MPQHTHSHLLDDQRVKEILPLTQPSLLLHDLGPEEDEKKLVEGTRQEVVSILTQCDPRLLVVVGPCSIHDSVAAMEYGELIARARERYGKWLQIIMRVYFEKPRTTVGWKGFINDPHLNETYDINTGLRGARKLLLDLAKISVPAGTEFLDVITPQYIADLIAWGAIGARTTESQVHRQLASGLSMPVGFKNRTDGGINVALDAILAARGEHCFLSVTKDGVAAIVMTAGNPDCHIILRGGSNGGNFQKKHVQSTLNLLQEKGLDPRVMIDFSHGNSQKDCHKQVEVAEVVAEQIREGNNCIIGAMIESNLEEGAQPFEKNAELRYGQSITDACVDWATTERMLEMLADAVKVGRM